MTRRAALPGTDRTTVQPNDPGGARFSGFSLRFWIILVLTGIGTGAAAGVLMLILRAIQHVSYSYQAGTFLDGIMQAPLYRRVVIVFAAGALASAGLFLLRNTPGGSGGKLDERIWFHSGRLPVLKTMAQAVLSITIVGMGASLGRENAPKQAGGAIASWLARQGGLSLAETRLLVACGVGAGMGAVYNVPFGGALFALEVLLGTLSLPLIPPALAVSFIATAVGWTLLPDRPTYIVPSYPVAFPQLVWSIWFGPVAGVASVLWVRLIIAADAARPGRRLMPVAPLFAFAALGLISLKFPELLGNGKDVAQLGFVGGMALPLMLALTFLKPIATAACLGSGAPGGLFTPTISLGAALGGFAGSVWGWLWPGALPGSYAMIGATAVLAGSMQAPVAAVVLMIELTHRINTIMVPILLAVAGASVVARRIDPRSVYSGRVDAGRRAAQEPRSAAVVRYPRLLRPAPTISLAANYPEVLERFVGAAGGAKLIYVLDENARLVGRIGAEHAACPPALTPVLSTAAACDLMQPVASLGPALSEAEVLARLAAEPAGELPVVDPGSGRLIGLAVQR